MLFGEKFKLRRESLKLSQGDIARLMGWSSAQFISNFERSIAYPPPKALRKMCAKYDWNYEMMAEEIIEEKIQRMRKDWDLK